MKKILIGVLALSFCSLTNAEIRSKGNFNYPVTKRMTNPLFVEFDSPMFESDSIGPLYTADASAHVWEDGRLYVYASHDMEPAQGCDRMDRYHVFSTDDMLNWTDHGEILNASQVEWGCPQGGFMWAPDCAYKNGKYYFYFPHPDDEAWWHTWQTGIAVSDYPDRDFKVIGFLEGAPREIDPCVFIDDDGQAYFYNGGGGRCFGGKLKENMIELDGEMVQMEGLEDFHEGTWIHKYNGKYYLSHADNHPGADGNRLSYAVSDSPLGPWKDMGVYVFPTGCGTDHGSIVEYKGQWYAFYHNCDYSGDWGLRSVCVDPLTIKEDGSIEVVKNWGDPYKKPFIVNNEEVIVEAENYNTGGNHRGFHKRGFDKIANKNYRKDNIGIRKDKKIGNYVESLSKGEWMRYSSEVKTPGKYRLAVRMKNGNPDSRFHVSINGIDQTGSMAPDANGEWTLVNVADIEFQPDSRYLDFRVENGEMDIDKFIISPIN
ncbi:MAG: family 43 glycosylhydrolase [Muribaculaceae bacterium]|nr:family 43 glycosylhydrolase [Muribaculaceae bacterium]